MKEQQAKRTSKMQAVADKRPATRPCRVRARVRGALLPGMLLGAMVGLHVLGIALLNLESARRERLEKEITQLRIQNEQLQARLKLSAGESELRRWAESQGMVRVDSAQTSVAVSLPTSEPTRTTVTAQLSER